MKTIALISVSLAALLVALLPATPAKAAVQTFVSGTGTDTGTCTRAAPCATFAFALGVTDAGGTITCVDAVANIANGPLLLLKSVTIDCTGTLGIIRPPLAVQASDGIHVTLRGLSILGNGSIGIQVTGSIVLHVENCRISEFQGDGGLGVGIFIAPNAGKTSEVYISDTLVSENGLAASGGGIIIQPSGSGSARVVLNRVQVEHNFQGILVDGTFSTGVILVDVRDSVVASNRGHGIAAISSAGHSPTGVIVDRTSSAFNAASGILAQGAAVHLGNSTVTGNATGLNVAGGQILSYQNNQTSGNFNDGAPTGVLTLR
jgi:hypothetical protein